MKTIALLTVLVLTLTSCSAERIANYNGFPWCGGGNGSNIDIHRVSVNGHYYIIETNKSIGTSNITKVR